MSASGYRKLGTLETNTISSRARMIPCAPKDVPFSVFTSDAGLSDSQVGSEGLEIPHLEAVREIGFPLRWTSNVLPE